MIAASAGLAAAARRHDVGEAGVLVDDDVVGAVDRFVERRFFEGLRRVGDGAQLRQIEHLHAVLTDVIRHHEGVVSVDFHVAPGVGRRAFGSRQVGHEDGR